MVEWLGPYPPPPPSPREKAQNPLWEQEYREEWADYEKRRDAYFHENRWSFRWSAVCWFAPAVVYFAVMAGIVALVVLCFLGVFTDDTEQPDCTDEVDRPVPGKENNDG